MVETANGLDWMRVRICAQRVDHLRYNLGRTGNWHSATECGDAECVVWWLNEGLTRLRFCARGGDTEELRMRRTGRPYPGASISTSSSMSSISVLANSFQDATSTDRWAFFAIHMACFAIVLMIVSLLTRVPAFVCWSTSALKKSSGVGFVIWEHRFANKRWNR